MTARTPEPERAGRLVDVAARPGVGAPTPRPSA